MAKDPERKNITLPDLKESDVTHLEIWIDEMDTKLETMKSFLLPGGHTTVSFVHIARCICRRAERVITELSGEDIVEPLILKYTNSLSDYLFVLSRKLSKDLNIKEHPWTPKM